MMNCSGSGRGSSSLVEFQLPETIRRKYPNGVREPSKPHYASMFNRSRVRWSGLPSKYFVNAS
jgi:hypothetical protein